MIQSDQITMYLDDVPTPLHDPVFGVSHQSAPGASFDDVLAAGTLSCLTITDLDSGSTRASINAATTVKFVASTALGNVDISGTVRQVADEFGGTHYSVSFLAS